MIVVCISSSLRWLSSGSEALFILPTCPHMSPRGHFCPRASTWVSESHQLHSVTSADRRDPSWTTIFSSWLWMETMSLHGPYLRETYFCSLDTSVLNRFHCSSSHVGTELNVVFFSTWIKVDVEFRSELMNDSALWVEISASRYITLSLLAHPGNRGFWMLKQAKFF